MIERHSPRYKEIQQRVESQPPLNVTLTKNPLLEELFTMIKTAPADWETLFKDQTLQFYKEALLPGALAELHLKNVLSKATQTFGGRIKFDPIPNHYQTKNFHFNVEPAGRFRSFLKDANGLGGDAIAEYDLITEIDTLPVIWEVKMGTRKSHQNWKIMYRNEHINKILSPLQEYYDQNVFGLVVVTPPEPKSTSLFYENFLRDGGNHISFANSLLDFKMAGLQVHAERMRDPRK